ncbi:hypothetical protein CGMCC3_g6889 [Colletotrichum fructicola]|nr:uncharacterized protein CGMCC3_g6889 [Colletotrichum fructicola]KAE9577024.1 hypothetical protein CGMCC3_g6889 [Colletotrichum fructicola]
MCLTGSPGTPPYARGLASLRTPRASQPSPFQDEMPVMKSSVGKAEFWLSSGHCLRQQPQSNEAKRGEMVQDEATRTTHGTGTPVVATSSKRKRMERFEVGATTG